MAGLAATAVRSRRNRNDSPTITRQSGRGSSARPPPRSVTQPRRVTQEDVQQGAVEAPVYQTLTNDQGQQVRVNVNNPAATFRASQQGFRVRSEGAPLRGRDEIPTTQAQNAPVWRPYRFPDGSVRNVDIRDQAAVDAAVAQGAVQTARSGQVRADQTGPNAPVPPSEVPADRPGQVRLERPDNPAPNAPNFFEQILAGGALLGSGDPAGAVSNITGAFGLDGLGAANAINPDDILGPAGGGAPGAPQQPFVPLGPGSATLPGVPGTGVGTGIPPGAVSTDLTNEFLDEGIAGQRQVRGQQQEAIQGLVDAAQGNVPSAAELQGRRNLAQIIAGQNAIAASAGGGALGGALARRQALSNTARLTADAAGRAQELRAREQAQARSALTAALQGAREQDKQVAGLGLRVGEAELGARTSLAEANLDARLKQLGIETDRLNALDKLRMSERLGLLDAATRERLARIDTRTRLAIANQAAETAAQANRLNLLGTGLKLASGSAT